MIDARESTIGSGESGSVRNREETQQAGQIQSKGHLLGREVIESREDIECVGESGNVRNLLEMQPTAQIRSQGQLLGRDVAESGEASQGREVAESREATRCVGGSGNVRNRKETQPSGQIQARRQLLGREAIASREAIRGVGDLEMIEIARKRNRQTRFKSMAN